ncbi:MAG TPA: recombination mediator RecR, partial [Cytophagaceae bacterium]|nr:recombination mediator RecR [Cytophagaceae bacterium]
NTVTLKLSEALTNARQKITYCKTCHAISDTEICDICGSHRREQSQVCIVEDIRDVIAIENTNQFYGVYHVLGGIISPMERVGPSDLKIDSLINRVAEGRIKELIFALSPTMEGDTTAFYITKKMKEFDVKITTIARGIPLGGELEYADEITLGRSIVTRISYEA